VKKKVFVLILALFMLLPVSGVFAHESKGLLFGMPSDDGELKVTDGNHGTFSRRLGNHQYIRWTFDSPKNIGSYYINFITVRVSYSVRFLDSNNLVISEKEHTEITDDFFDFQHKNVHAVEVYVYRNNSGLTGGLLAEFDVYESKPIDINPPDNINEVDYLIEDKLILFSYNLPTNQDFSHVKIYQDGVLIADNVTDTSYTVDNLEYGGTYNFKFTTVDTNGNESEGVVETVTIATPELEEIKEVNAEASHDRVDLSWSLPETEYFEHVNIYRKSVSDVQTFSLLSVDEYDPLFETNGTYFNDLTVEEQTTYDYKLTTEFQGLESEGVTVQATTLVAPPPELGGQEFEEQENGDYLVSWQQPETGQVRILVDGQEYVVVPATDKQYTIPASDMKYSALGDPLVGLQTIGDNGEESEVEQQESNVNLPFGINELLTTSAGLLRVIGSLILLGLSFILAPKFIKVIKQSLNNKKNAETERTEREKRVSERAYREPRETRISTREGRTSTRVPREYRKGE
jgi:hypothetical protein